MTNDGPHYPLPYAGEGSVGLGKPLKPIVHPLRADIPIWLGAEGPKNVAQTAEIADGWIPIFYTPKQRRDVPALARRGVRAAGRSPYPCGLRDRRHLPPRRSSPRTSSAVIEAMKPDVSLYMGGMGAKEQNFHKQVFERMGYADLADQVQKLYLSGEKDEATALIPDELVDDMHIIGTRVRGQGAGGAVGGDRGDDAAAQPAAPPRRSRGSRRCSPDVLRQLCCSSAEGVPVASQRVSAGLGSVLPAESTARTAKVCHPGCRSE